MAEIGLIASILGVAGAGLKLALTLREVAIQISDARRQIHDLATSVSLFSMTLKQIGNCIKDNSSPYSDGAVETLEETVDECRAIFFEIDSMIIEIRKSGRRKNHGQPVSLMGRVSWVFEQSRVQYLSTRLESSKLTLSIMLQVFALRVAMERLEYCLPCPRFWITLTDLLSFTATLEKKLRLPKKRSSIYGPKFGALCLIVSGLKGRRIIMIAAA